MKFNIVYLADDGIEREYISKFVGKTHYLGETTQKLKAAHPVNYFPWFLGKNIKTCPPSKLFLFTSLLN